ncbi:hypothetical protein CRENBAI_001910 [Crenichthys baileyi]|uniref:Uncharacterized protein n=1 Tax=Crenichthys baileyi TaxID=28760 RepID=A0AAV9SFR4_9TELE
MKLSSMADVRRTAVYDGVTEDEDEGDGEEPRRCSLSLISAEKPRPAPSEKPGLTNIPLGQRTAGTPRTTSSAAPEEVSVNAEREAPRAGEKSGGRPLLCGSAASCYRVTPSTIRASTLTHKGSYNAEPDGTS